MNKNILSSLEAFPYFTIEGVKQLAGDDSIIVGTVRTALYRWMKTGEVIQLKNGVYMTRRFYELHRADENFSPAVSAILIPQSYVSLDFILQKHSILTDITYPVSSLTRKNTRVFENKIGLFTYHHIKESLYCGFHISDYLGISIAQASVAKALFDYLYLRPGIMGIGSVSYNLAEELRLNLEDLPSEIQQEFAQYVEISCSRKMDRILTNLRSTIWRP